ncbi:type VI secretion system tip protein VgrG [Bradyrhizobium sp. U87765 SZCCT0131]|uniref:type VI secretion system Vgr family protein n=1 Tax=unclassified Bradyrhizobium TaxID=2631580 RepID=UPI001BA7B3E9|nr:MULTISPECIES: type VI secretion system tip protein TssI/VgrG [unclassified Bradyrhizobium]MBR1220438.1 type VI secretion system tip protein VgrG [Bradyrhizobium sp. U87765 SZCCT0131]MBR1263107.1 type VI secretion system tip protein VgrG [Bradyrhizobium sp. U87765 SZCCT0134]MBR1307010.1 type VI secretion system tip protein VgrG [Bradyrhizobium sp. U87765 SZCCT0110]MBR1323102.1 type VI secretion system tip protein VgrG [Bradyrhizobium sp. U87765 SZCCT0109]MBR1345964.1 type VI secretion system
MGQALTQDTRLCELTTPLGKDVLVFIRLDGSEGLSELFEYRIECLSEEADLDFDKAIGQQCTLKIKLHDKVREFSGILVEAQWLGVRDDYFRYRIVLRPWLWLLSRTTDCRIFQDKKAPDIIKEVFNERGFTDYESKLTEEGSCPTLEYCVQYRETDMNFVCRLMEQHGIYYFFKHEGGKHTLVLADSRSSHTPIDGLASIPYIPLAGADRRNEQHIYEWVSERRFRTGKVELNDYNYQKPNAQMTSDAKGSEHYTRAEMEFYDYPGKYKEKSDGERYAKVQLQSEQALDRRRHGNGDAVNLFPGGLTKLEKHSKDAQNVEYLVVRATHSFELEAYRSGGRNEAGRHVYFGAYEFLPSDRPFRAPILTPKPRIHGIQTAKVVTKDDNSSEEIDVEQLGEIYVRFFWDRKKMRSCKLRVAQVWSGKRWGGQIIPRVGQEVVVEFLEGDPDRPLVIGTVYNDEYKLPYDLPSKKTIAGLKSDSTKGGGGYNEWNFEDKKGSEQIGVHAERDLDVVVRNVETRTIGEAFVAGDSRQTTLKSGNDKLDIELGGQHVTLAMDQSVQAGMTISLTANVMISLQVGASSITLTPAAIIIDSPIITATATGPMMLTGTPVNVGVPVMTHVPIPLPA